MTHSIPVLCALLAGIAAHGAAVAQNPQPAPPNEEHPTMAPPNSPQPLPEQIAPGARSPDTTGGGSLSERLSRQQGTLQPPAVDPGIRVPAPSETRNTMPVIPPPGTPGGDQKVVPK